MRWLCVLIRRESVLYTGFIALNDAFIPSNINKEGRIEVYIYESNGNCKEQIYISLDEFHTLTPLGFCVSPGDALRHWPRTILPDMKSFLLYTEDLQISEGLRIHRVARNLDKWYLLLYLFYRVPVPPYFRIKHA